MKPLLIDLFCGLGGWADGGLAEGYHVVGFDNEQHVYGDHRYPGQLVIQDVLTIHGRQFKNAALIVASPPCQEYSYMAMPWSKAKAIRTDYLSGKRDRKKLTALFDACFRIQRESCEAAGRHIPMVVENVRGAQEWVGRAAWNFGSFYLWGDVPALMPIIPKRVILKQGIAPMGDGVTNFHGQKVPGFRFDGSGKSFQTASVVETGYKSTGLNWSDPEKRGQDFTRVAGNQNGVKQGGDWFNSTQPSISRLTGSKSSSRKAASAMIAKIPFVLSRHIARSWKPKQVQSL